MFGNKGSAVDRRPRHPRDAVDCSPFAFRPFCAGILFCFFCFFKVRAASRGASSLLAPRRRRVSVPSRPPSCQSVPVPDALPDASLPYRSVSDVFPHRLLLHWATSATVAKQAASSTVPARPLQPRCVARPIGRGGRPLGATVGVASPCESDLSRRRIVSDRVDAVSHQRAALKRAKKKSQTLVVDRLPGHERSAGRASRNEGREIGSKGRGCMQSILSTGGTQTLPPSPRLRRNRLAGPAVALLNHPWLSSRAKRSEDVPSLALELVVPAVTIIHAWRVYIPPQKSDAGAAQPCLRFARSAESRTVRPC